MPPKPLPASDDDGFSEEESTEESSDESSEESSSSSTESDESSENEAEFRPSGAGAAAGAGVIKNKPHDEEFVVSGAATKLSGGGAAPAAASKAPPAAAGGSRGAAGASTVVQNKPHDEEFAIDPKTGAGAKPVPKAAPSAVPAGSGKAGKMANNPNDEFEDVEDDMSDEPTPPKPTAGPKPSQAASGAPPAGVTKMQNAPVDEVWTINNSNSKAAASSSSAAPAYRQAPAPASQMTTMKPPTPSSDGSDGSESEDSEGHSPQQYQQPQKHGKQIAGAVDTSQLSSNMSSGAAVGGATVLTSGLEYNPSDYAQVTASVPADVRDIFTYITAYQATVVDCPSKLRPFIPDYIPSVGDIDTFCKVPRPDDKADNYGLTVVDEPCSNMSNPAIVKQILLQTNNVSGAQLEDMLCSSLDNASTRPEAIDKWIEDVRGVHNTKAAPSVYYSKPMPSIDSLMQAWPQGFEDVLNSDLQLPPPGIDLDMQQYARMLCAILDIPVHSNLVESLHVMFTLYLEFRENQHFKAA